ncbi:hypothetical protein [Methylobacterium sp. SD21]|uniref:hypothetical protein n=1 Tax=Methylobacterium litchii TaxID=3138810 RepID=UPI00313D7C36
MMFASIPLAHPVTASKAARKAADRERKREARKAMRQAGVPDPRMLDAAIVDAMRDAIAAGGGPDGSTTIPLREVLRLAARSLQGRTQQGIALDRAEMHRSLANRLAPRRN